MIETKRRQTDRQTDVLDTAQSMGDETETYYLLNVISKMGSDKNLLWQYELKRMLSIP